LEKSNKHNNVINKKMENTNYEWVISAMDCKIKEGTLENVVNVIHWRLKASNENYVAETYGVTSVPEPSDKDFTLYNDLKKEQVVSWIVDILSVVPEPINEVEQQSQLDKIKESLNNDLSLQAKPVIVTLQPPFDN
jgi:hypothetical protein